MILIGFQAFNACMFDNPLAVKGNGQLAIEQRNIKSFNAIEVSGGFEVELTQSGNEELTIEADENLMRFIVTEVHGKTLKIYSEGGLNPQAGLKARIAFNELRSIELSGAVKLYGNNVIRLKDLEIDGSGASDIELSLQAVRLNVDLSGASKLRLEGNADNFLIEGSGASKFYAAELKTASTRLDLSGASFAEVWATGSLELEASGASEIRYKGDPETIRTNTSGASSINKY